MAHSNRKPKRKAQRRSKGQAERRFRANLHPLHDTMVRLGKVWIATEAEYEDDVFDLLTPVDGAPGSPYRASA